MIELIDSAGDRDVEQPRFLRLLGGRQRRAVGDQAVLRSGHDHERPLTTLRAVERQQRDRAVVRLDVEVVERRSRVDPAAEPAGLLRGEEAIDLLRHASPNRVVVRELLVGPQRQRLATGRSIRIAEGELQR